MYVIGVCDDDREHRQILVEMCERYFKERESVGKCIAFSSAEEVLEYDGEKMLLLFLDIEMKKLNGIELARMYETREKVWRIIFVTNHKELVFESFGMIILGFEPKPIKYARIYDRIRLAERESLLEGSITFRYCNKLVSLEGGDIICLKAEGNYTVIFTDKGSFCVSGQLHIWEKKLSNTPFIRCHRSYLVNVLKIRKMNSGELTLEGFEESIPVGKLYNGNLTRLKTFYTKRIAEMRVGI